MTAGAREARRGSGRHADTGAMAHVSRPLLIALAATVALMAVWLVALRPKPVAIENTPLSSTKVIPQANQAAAVSDAANAKRAGRGGRRRRQRGAAAGTAAPRRRRRQPAATPQAGTLPAKARKPRSGAAPRAATRRSSGRRAGQGRRPALLELQGRPTTSRRAARCATSTATAARSSCASSRSPTSRSYTSVTRGVKIAAVADDRRHRPQGRTRVIAGLTEPRELSQAVGDALAGR